MDLAADSDEENAVANEHNAVFEGGELSETLLGTTCKDDLVEDEFDYNFDSHRPVGYHERVFQERALPQHLVSDLNQASLAALQEEDDEYDDEEARQEEELARELQEEEAFQVGTPPAISNSWTTFHVSATAEGLALDGDAYADGLASWGDGPLTGEMDMPPSTACSTTTYHKLPPSQGPWRGPTFPNGLTTQPSAARSPPNLPSSQLLEILTSHARPPLSATFSAPAAPAPALSNGHLHPPAPHPLPLSEAPQGLPKGSEHPIPGYPPAQSFFHVPPSTSIVNSLRAGGLSQSNSGQGLLEADGAAHDLPAITASLPHSALSPPTPPLHRTSPVPQPMTPPPYEAATNSPPYVSTAPAPATAAHPLSPPPTSLLFGPLNTPPSPPAATHPRPPPSATVAATAAAPATTAVTATAAATATTAATPLPAPTTTTRSHPQPPPTGAHPPPASPARRTPTPPAAPTPDDEWDTANREREQQLATQQPPQAAAAQLPITYSEALEHLQGSDLHQFHGEVLASLEQGGGAGDGGWWSKFRCFLRHVPADVRDEQVQLLSLARLQFSDADPLHLRLLSAVFAAYEGPGPIPPRYGAHWAQLGFQGTDPATDLRGCGMLGLLHLLRLHGHHPPSAACLYRLSRHPQQEFPLAIVSMNATKWTLQVLRSGTLLSASRKPLHAAAADFYIGAMYSFYRRWSQGATMAESGFVLKQVADACIRRPAHTIAQSSSHLTPSEGS